MALDNERFLELEARWQKDRWFLPSECLPVKYADVLIQTTDNRVLHAYLSNRGWVYFVSFGTAGLSRNEVTKWKPCPEFRRPTDGCVRNHL